MDLDGRLCGASVRRSGRSSQSVSQSVSCGLTVEDEQSAGQGRWRAVKMVRGCSTSHTSRG